MRAMQRASAARPCGGAPLARRAAHGSAGGSTLPRVPPRRRQVCAHCRHTSDDNDSRPPAAPESADEQAGPPVAPARRGAAGDTRIARGVLRLGAPVALAAAVPGLLPQLNGAQNVVEAVLILCGIVAFHEAGHFTAARAQGIHVSRFSIGFGPKLLSLKPGEVEFSLRALPLGGYVAFPDNDEDCPYPEDDPDLLKNRPILDRFFVISAGVVFNMILAFMVTTAEVNNVGYTDAAFEAGVRVPVIMANSAAARYGMRPGDVILQMDAEKVPAGPSAVRDVVSYVRDHRDVSIDLTVARLPAGDKRGAMRAAPEIEHVQVLPDIGPDGNGRIGVQLAPNAHFTLRHADGPIEVVRQSAASTWRLARSTFDGFIGIVTNWGRAQESVSGPLAVVAVGAEVARSSPSGLYSFIAAVNVNLAVVNALPLPALDGGYLLLLAVEALRREKLPKEAEALFNVSGFLLLFGLGSFLILRDVFNLLPK